LAVEWKELICLKISRGDSSFEKVPLAKEKGKKAKKKEKGKEKEKGRNANETRTKHHHLSSSSENAMKKRNLSYLDRSAIRHRYSSREPETRRQCHPSSSN
jgi:hypothetical protein